MYARRNTAILIYSNVLKELNQFIYLIKDGKYILIVVRYTNYYFMG